MPFPPVGTPPNLAYYYVTGPVHVYVRFPSFGVGPYRSPDALVNSGTILFLGHAKESPDPGFEPKYIPVISSLAGPEVPDDEIYAGGEYQVQIEFSRFNMTVLNKLKAFPRYSRGGVQGTETYLDRGTLLLAQGLSYELWLYNSFYNTPNAAAYPDLTPGYYYSSVRTGTVLPRNLTRDAKRAELHFVPVSARQGVVGDFVTYSQDPKWFANLPSPG